MYRADYRRIRPLARGAGVRVRVVSQKGLPEWLSRYRDRVGVLLGEFAARYVDVYGEGPHPKWVTVVKGAELYIPDWTHYVIGGDR